MNQLSLYDEPHVAVLRRIDAAIARMSLCEQTEITKTAIANLSQKRKLVESDNYVLRNVSVEIIGKMGAEIGHLTKATGLRNKNIKW